MNNNIIKKGNDFYVEKKIIPEKFIVGKTINVLPMAFLSTMTGNQIIEDKKFIYDETTGEKFEILQVHNEWFDTRTGKCHSKTEFNYYLDIKI